MRFKKKEADNITEEPVPGGGPHPELGGGGGPCGIAVSSYQKNINYARGFFSGSNEVGTLCIGL
ncbi:hypothetical protein EHQ53_04810 [Leptospira langatensis]|uniref:Uncharacterized protein n=1 Tax=Leptospira langatensis TaxID=2484983 RepID=A0ABY2MF40_9LEPT|nr:hypothetical protein EHQ53_04810 [Leptospira langatensis]